MPHVKHSKLRGYRENNPSKIGYDDLHMLYYLISSHSKHMFLLS